MAKFIIRRILQMIPTLFIITILIFTLIKLTPGDPIGSDLNPKATAEQKAAERARLGLDKPIPVQYINWLGRTVQGDFGESYTYKKPVASVINDYIWNTFYLNITSFVFAFLIAVPLGVFVAVRQHSKTDTFFSVLSIVGISLPSFFFSLLLIYVFAIKLNLFPIGGMLEPGSTTAGFGRVIEVLHHMFLPALVAIITSCASLLRYSRTAVLDVLKQDYVRTARSKGLSEKVVIYKHAFRNALIPIITIAGFYIASLFSGAVILESVFNWPGIGQIFMQSITSADYNVMMALMTMFALLTLLGNLLADVLYALADPRIKLD
ncbi:MAG: ABC transporter permease [Lachnospirales bacterium]